MTDRQAPCDIALTRGFRATVISSLDSQSRNIAVPTRYLCEYKVREVVPTAKVRHRYRYALMGPSD